MFKGIVASFRLIDFVWDRLLSEFSERCSECRIARNESTVVPVSPKKDHTSFFNLGVGKALAACTLFFSSST